MAATDTRWTYIYVLVDPRTQEVRYVGQTVNPPERLRLHIKDVRSNTHKVAWIRSLLRAGVRPLLVVVDFVEGDGAEAEARWMDHYRSAGARLTNLATAGTSGPLGMRLPCPQERRERISKVMRRMPPDHEAQVRRMCFSGMSQRQVAAALGVSQGHVSRVVNS